MPQLNWNENDLLECLEVSPQVSDYEVKHFYQVTQDDFVLAVSVWQHESLVVLSLCQEKSDAPLIEFALCVRRAVRYVHDKRGEYLEFGNCVVAPDRFAYQAVGNMFDETVFKPSLTVQLAVKPHIQIRCVRP